MHNFRAPGRPIIRNRFINTVALACALVCLTACDLADSIPDVTQPVSVISPGYQVRIGGHVVPVSGFDDCLLQHDAASYAEKTDEHSCIVLSANRSDVKVRLHQSGGPVTETWRIIREKDMGGRETVRLQRPDGTFVTAATR